MSKKRHIHFVGIKGVGLASLAVIAKEAGFSVSGCDVDEEFITDELLKRSSIQPIKGFSLSHLANVDMVITTGAHGGFDNPEVWQAKKQGLEVLTHGEAVGEFMKGSLFGRHDMQGISIAGSHGKTTTTALIATILSCNRLDPSYAIGTSSVSSLGGAAHYGKGTYFVAEADEYATELTYDKTPKLLWQHPSIAVITNVDFDHPDVFSNEKEILYAFIEFIKGMKKDGTLIIYGDDPYAPQLKKAFSGKVITYGYAPHNTFVLKKTSFRTDRTFFWVEGNRTSLGEFVIGAIGEHNALNALGALAVGLEVGIGIEGIRRSLALFKGSKRRLEYVGETTNGAVILDDYAHHPTEIEKTLQAVKKAYPGKRITCVFQPHTYSRTRVLFNQFVHAFSNADEVILTDIFPSLREDKDLSVSSFVLSNEMARIHRSVTYLPRLTDVVQYMARQTNTSDSIILTMGAGNVYTVAYKLVNG